MQKILLAIDAVDPDRSLLTFGYYLARLTNSKITGLFLENIVAEEKPSIKAVAGRAYLDWVVNEQSEQHQQKMHTIENNIQQFMQQSVNEGVACDIQRKEGVPYRELEDESRYADIIVLSSDTSFKKRYEGSPTTFTRDVLSHVECPVIVAPKSFSGIKQIFVAFDGSAASMIALKQFSYLFPQFIDNKITILHADENSEWLAAGYDGLGDWLHHHYKDVEFVTLTGHAATALFDYLIDKENFLLVMGAYGRSNISRFFSHSKATTLLNILPQAIFIAH